MSAPRRLRAVISGELEAPAVEPAAFRRPYRKHTIGIDFDRTFTADRDLYGSLIKAAALRGHRVFCVTSRSDTSQNRALLRDSFGEFYQYVTPIFCGHKPKRAQVSLAGFQINVWIDDIPEVITARNANEVSQWERAYNSHETIPLTDAQAQDPKHGT